MTLSDQRRIQKKQTKALLEWQPHSRRNLAGLSHRRHVERGGAGIWQAEDERVFLPLVLAARVEDHLALQQGRGCIRPANEDGSSILEH